jgi:hypothetical protein
VVEAMKLYEIIEAREDDDYAPYGFDYETTDAFTEKIVDYMHENCRPWLQAISIDYPIYRGIRHQSIAFTRAVRPDREPHDSSFDMHQLYNELIAIAGGTANRSNSAFVSSNYHEAKAYGHPYRVFPIGDFAFTWSPEWPDWYQTLEGDSSTSNEPLVALMYDNVRASVFDIMRNKENDLSPKAVFEAVRNELFKIENYDPRKVKSYINADKELQNAVQSGHEIMIECDRMLYIDKEVFETRIKGHIES